MKSRKLFTFVLLTFLFGSPAWAQIETIKAELTQSGIIQIPENEPLTHMYEINISDLNFTNQAEAIAFFKDYNGDGFFIRPVVHHDIAMVYLQLSQNPERSIDDWNTHLNAVMENKSLTRKSVRHAK